MGCPLITKLQGRFQIFYLEISQPPHSGNFFSESENSGTGLYSVKTDFFTVDEKTAKEKKTTETFYTPATSNADANHRIIEHLRDTMSDYVIRDAKFDRAEAIYWPTEVHRNKTQEYDKQ